VRNSVQAGGWKVAEFKGNTAPKCPSVETNEVILELFLITGRTEGGSSVTGTGFVSLI
jgi:hypothetical protein